MLLESKRSFARDAKHNAEALANSAGRCGETSLGILAKRLFVEADRREKLCIAQLATAAFDEADLAVRS